MRKVKLTGILILLTFFMVAMGCASFEVRTAQTLSIAKASQDAGVHSIAKLCEMGKLSETDCLYFKEKNDALAKVHTEAVKGFAKYLETKTPGDQWTLEPILSKLTIMIGTVTNIVIDLTKKVSK